MARFVKFTVKRGKRVKWYQYRDKNGRFSGCKAYKVCHGRDLKRKSKAEK